MSTGMRYHWFIQNTGHVIRKRDDPPKWRALQAAATIVCFDRIRLLFNKENEGLGIEYERLS
jgi:hypothetical protein